MGRFYYERRSIHIARNLTKHISVKKREKNKKLKRILCNFITIKELIKIADEYSQNSSLHGLRYVGNKNLHIAERCFWVISFLMATFTSIYFITNLIQKWYAMPVIMSLSPKSNSITSIPFPAITICNMNNARKTIAQSILNNQTNSDTKITKKLLNDFCDEDTIFGNTFEDNVTISWHSVQDFMIKVSQPCHEMILLCILHGQIQNCNKIFHPVLTDEGMCCVYNKIDDEYIFRETSDSSNLKLKFPYESVDWTPETGYLTNTQSQHLPWRPVGAGSHLGLTVILDAELHEYYCSSEASHGFKV